MLVVIVSACCVFVRVMITRRRMEMFGFGYLCLFFVVNLLGVVRSRRTEGPMPGPAGPPYPS